MKVYYAHCLAIYNTPQEERDIKLLADMGFQVENPNQKHHSDAYLKIRQEGGSPMEYFTDLVQQCDAVAFRGLPGGLIPAGVFKEVSIALEKEMPVIELPCYFNRATSVEETRTFLKEIGER
jgi:hypothetical protein